MALTDISALPSAPTITGVAVPTLGALTIPASTHGKSAAMTKHVYAPGVSVFGGRTAVEPVLGQPTAAVHTSAIATTPAKPTGLERTTTTCSVAFAGIGPKVKVPPPVPTAGAYVARAGCVRTVGAALSVAFAEYFCTWPLTVTISTRLYWVPPAPIGKKFHPGHAPQVRSTSMPVGDPGAAHAGAPANIPLGANPGGSGKGRRDVDCP